ncbi:hypothetical protein [Actinokineospora bangkokensis]|uniref:hypothetical protein n=1 Tax=Actinokineospora bangkokensis TaxID=1193682 RepID=UPI000ACC4D41|nr:hypothetical protein [Actinokineospora bangkokensis]
MPTTRPPAGLRIATGLLGRATVPLLPALQHDVATNAVALTLAMCFLGWLWRTG